MQPILKYVRMKTYLVYYGSYILCITYYKIKEFFNFLSELNVKSDGNVIERI